MDFCLTNYIMYVLYAFIATCQKKGYITWHLYASHAHIELRCNRCPEVAARVFELGITRHRSFLTCPSYIREYAHLLLEQGDHDNLRSLLERAIAACQQELGIGGSNKNISLTKYNQRQRSLWDMLLEFESNVSLADPNVIRNLEARRRRALPSEQQQLDDNDLLPKSIQEQLTRVGGECDGLICGGLGRMVQRYELIGILGYGGGEQEELGESSLNDTSSTSAAVNYGGRKSDASFSYRYHGLSLSHPSEMTGSTTPGVVSFNKLSCLFVPLSFYLSSCSLLKRNMRAHCLLCLVWNFDSTLIPFRVVLWIVHGPHVSVFKRLGDSCHRARLLQEQLVNPWICTTTRNGCELWWQCYQSRGCQECILNHLLT